VDQLIALVGLRLRLDLRALLGARERLWGALLALPFALVTALAIAGLAYVATRAAAAHRPETLPALLSLVATVIGLLWALAPLASGVALSESHDLTRVVHFPVRPALLVLASLTSNLIQPAVLLELPTVAALALALTPHPLGLLLTLPCAWLSVAFTVTAGQTVGLLLHGIARRRRLHDALLFVGVGFAFVVSAGPFLLLSVGGRSLSRAGDWLLASVLPALSPFGWGLRAAWHAGQGELGVAALYTLAALLAIGGLVAACAWLVGRIYRGEADLGGSRARRARPARALLAGQIGTLLEKDLRVMWREPALKAALVLGLAGPLLFLFFMTRLTNAPPRSTTLFVFATLIGVGGLGANAFGFERRAIAGLFAFPVARWRLLVAKNLAAMALRLPGLAMLLVAGLLLAPLPHLAAAATIVVTTLLVASGLDNYISILMPVAVPPPGGNPYGGPQAGGRGLVGLLVNFAALLAVLALTAPFTFLAWLPALLEQPVWSWLTLPLALAGAAAAYAMLVAGAAALLERREPQMLARILGDG
jgi:ABC-2 type transport system permease protein